MRRVVITGIGLVTPIGNNLEDTWSALVAGQSGAGPITRFDTDGFGTHIACEVKGFDPLPYLAKREAKRLDLFLHYAISAGLMAMADAGYEDHKIPEAEAEDWGAYIGSGQGGISTIERAHLSAMEKGARFGFSPHFITNSVINMAPGLLSIKCGLKGPNFSHVSACSTGAHSIGEAARAIAHGDCIGMLAGSAEATISFLGIGGFNAMHALSTRNDDPTAASRPFDKDRDGFVCGEGAGVLVLEELEHAKARGAHIYCEVVGYAASSDAFHVTQPAHEGEGAQRCMARALRDARLHPADIQYVNAHGTSTQLNDKSESIAIRKVFGSAADQLMVSSTKSMTGHMMGAAGGVEAAFSSLTIDRGVVPPTINYTTPDPDCDLDYVPNQAREMRVERVLSNSFGFGGTNACLIFARYRGD